MTVARKDILMKDPSRIFDTPAELAGSEELFDAQKIAALEQWKDEIEKYIDAEAESMTGNSENAERLKQVSDALISLYQGGADESRRIPASPPPAST